MVLDWASIDFVDDPSGTMQQICRALQIPFDQGFLERWHLNQHITGDNKKSSRGSSGAEASMIRPLPRREVDETLLKTVESNPDYQRILALLDYQTTIRATA